MGFVVATESALRPRVYFSLRTHPLTRKRSALRPPGLSRSALRLPGLSAPPGKHG